MSAAVLAERRRRRRATRWRALLLAAAAAGAASVQAARYPYCGDTGVWVQILGAGSAALNDRRAGSSYLVWVDNRARLLVNAGPGAALRFEEARAAFADLDAIVFNALRTATSADLPAFLEGSIAGDRRRPLPVYAPPWRPASAPAAVPARTFFERLLGPAGPHPHLAVLLAPAGAAAPYPLTVGEAPRAGGRRWQLGDSAHGVLFRSEHLTLNAKPLQQAGWPAVAWKVRAGGFALVFAGGFGERGDDVSDFAADADALIVDHAITEGARGDALRSHATPGKLGRIAAKADARMMILGHRASATLGRESASRAAIQDHYPGTVLFAADLDCWGM